MPKVKQQVRGRILQRGRWRPAWCLESRRLSRKKQGKREKGLPGRGVVRALRWERGGKDPKRFD